MIRLIAVNIIRFAFVILLQGVIVNKVLLMEGMVRPFIYVFALLMLPLETPRWLLMIIGLVTGLIVDAFGNTQGLHASACVLMCYLMPYVQRLISPREGYEFGLRPTLQDMGLRWYVTYALILVFVHHLWLFYLEFFKFSEFFSTFARVSLSSLATLLLLVIGQYLIFTQKARA